MKNKFDFSLLTARICVYAISIIMTLLCLVPVVILLVNATRSTHDILRGITLIPSTHFMTNLGTISFDLLGINIWRAMANSLMISSSAAVLSVYVSSLTAYAIKVYKDAKWNKFFYGMVLAIIMIPSQLSIIGFFVQMSSMDLLNNYIPLIFPMAAAPATVFFIKQYLEATLQVSLVEAARIDGARELYTFHRIMIPLMAPAIATMGLISFIMSWNNFLTPFILLNRMELYTIPLMITVLNLNNVTPDHGARFAALAISLIPVIAVYIFTGKYIVSGISIGGVKE